MPRRAANLLPLADWLRAREKIAHRDQLLRAGFRVAELRELVRSGEATLIRRAWIALPSAADDLVTAARAGGRVSCTSLARRRGWWMPDRVGDELHIHMSPGSGSARLGDEWPGVLHWTKPVVPVARHELEAPTEEALAHIAVCQPFEVALVLWESAARVEGLSGDALRRIRFGSRAARDVAASVVGLSDSGLETLVVLPLRGWGVPVRQQVKIAGRRVDVLVGERLVLQIDGFEHHRTSAQRSSDIAHDAELRLRGYTVLRLSYAQIVHDWAGVERLIRRALAAGLHVAA
jgi:very-short-patch-repair endonuclease